MKTNYLLRSKHSNPLLKIVTVVMAVLVLGFGFFRLLGGQVITLISPFWKLENGVTVWVSDLGTSFRSKEALVAENRSLRDELFLRKIRLSSLNASRSREQELLALLGRAESLGGVLASALSRPPQSPYDVVVIDAGKEDGIEDNFRVFVPDGPVVGVVKEAFSHNAKVSLYSTFGEETEGILERGGVPVTLSGMGGGNFKITMERDLEVEIGDRIVSRDVEAWPLAIVEDISMKPTDSSKSVLARSPVNIFSLRYVLVAP